MMDGDIGDIAVILLNRLPDEGPKRPTSVTPREAQLSDAPGINVRNACARGMSDAVRNEKARRWQEANAAGFDAWNLYVERHGAPFAQYRKF